MPDSYPRSDSYESSHPTLTEKGLRMMRESPLVDSGPTWDSQWLEAPGSGQNGVPIEPLPSGEDQPAKDSGRVSEATLAVSNADGYPGPFFTQGASERFANLNAIDLQNVRPSREFATPTDLVRQSLRKHFVTRQFTPTADPDQCDHALRAIGRLVIHFDDQSWDRPAFGSAWIMGPSLIATCAHNLFDSNRRRWSRRLEFYPAFDHYSDLPPVQCNVTSCMLPTGYLDNPATNDDIAFCYVDRNIGDIVGASIPMEPPEDNSFFDDHPVVVAGFPAGSEFDFGKRLWLSRGKYLFGRSGGSGTPFAPVVASNLGGGCSGGPWLWKKPGSDGQADRWVAVGLSSGHARLNYDRGGLNLMSLTSPMLQQERLDQLLDQQAFHRFEGVS